VQSLAVSGGRIKQRFAIPTTYDGVEADGSFHSRNRTETEPAHTKPRDAIAQVLWLLSSKESNNTGSCRAVLNGSHILLP
jgi:hypothetical protein